MHRGITSEIQEGPWKAIGTLLLIFAKVDYENEFPSAQFISSMVSKGTVTQVVKKYVDDRTYPTWVAPTLKQSTLARRGAHLLGRGPRHGRGSNS